jgi:glycosyltransferase involved in cell wall biosynthesis
VRIVIATFHRNLVGGTEKYLQAILPALINRGHQVALLYEIPFDPMRESVDPPEASLTGWCLAELGVAAAMRAVSEWKPDVVYNQGLQDGDLEDALLDSLPTVLFAHGYYGTCGTGSKCHSFPQIRPCNRRFGPACLLLHYPRRCGALDPREAWHTYKRQAHRRARLSDYRAILVASAHMRDEFLRHGLSGDQVQLAPLPNLEIAQQSTQPEPATPPWRILMIGRLTAVKGGHYLIPAIAQASKTLNRPLKLTIAGDGPERIRLESVARRLQISVEFTGWVDTPGKIELLRKTDLLAAPSVWPEPFGLVGLEAACLGVPAVGYAVGGVPDWLVPGLTGELAPGDPPSIEGLADAIVRALRIQSHYADLCQGARQFSRNFTLEAHLAKLEPALTFQTSGSLMKSGSLVKMEL